MSTYDDNESFADDKPEDLIYLVNRARFLDDLIEQIDVRAREGGLNPEVWSRRIAAIFRPDDRVIVTKLEAHARLRQILDEDAIDQPLRQYLANEILTLVQQHTDFNLGQVG